LPVVCIIDEFPALGRMGEMVRTLAEIAGYGVRFWLFVQSLSQLKALYPHDWNVLVSQCGTLSVFGVTDGETVKWLSDELGQRTQALALPGVNLGGAGRDPSGGLNVNAGTNQTVQLTGAPLLTPGEIRELLGVGQPWQLVFLSGKRPILSQRVDYFQDERLAAMVGSTTPDALPRAGHSLRGSKYWKGVPRRLH
jgi:type IV secretion system protein VirD4